MLSPIGEHRWGDCAALTNLASLRWVRHSQSKDSPPVLAVFVVGPWLGMVSICWLPFRGLDHTPRSVLEILSSLWPVVLEFGSLSCNRSSSRKFCPIFCPTQPKWHQWGCIWFKWGEAEGFKLLGTGTVLSFVFAECLAHWGHYWKQTNNNKGYRWTRDWDLGVFLRSQWVAPRISHSLTSI